MIKFIQSSGIVTAMVGLLSALPETQLFKRLHDAGRIIKNPTGNNTDFTINFVPKMNVDTLITGYKKVLSSIFTPKNFYDRVETHLREYKKYSKSQSLPITTLLRALSTAIWKLGIREKGKRYFWRLCIRTALRRPTLLPEAISLSIFGFHFRKVLISQLEVSNS
jgi:hypothetical protein